MDNDTTLTPGQLDLGDSVAAVATARGIVLAVAMSRQLLAIDGATSKVIWTARPESPDAMGVLLESPFATLTASTEHPSGLPVADREGLAEVIELGAAGSFDAALGDGAADQYHTQLAADRAAAGIPPAAIISLAAVRAERAANAHANTNATTEQENNTQ